MLAGEFVALSEKIKFNEMHDKNNKGQELWNIALFFGRIF